MFTNYLQCKLFYIGCKKGWLGEKIGYITLLGRYLTMITSNINCLEEPVHHVEAHCMRHMLLLNDFIIGQIESRTT